jgi:Uma2 family endonuclease
MSIVDRSSVGSTSGLAPVASRATPRLQTGDRLTRAEFERRYSAMPEVKHAELIEGIVFMPSPVRLTAHGQPHAALVGWITYYVSKTPGLLFGDNATSRLDEDNEPQPDVMLLCPVHTGGAAVVDEDGYVSGAPELVCEVAASSVSIDLHAKKNAYRRNGVKEYLVWRTEDAAVDWFELVEGRYDSIAPDDKGVLRSQVFPGLWLDAPALLRGDLATVFATVDAGTAISEHQAFAQRLASEKPV